MMVLCSLITWWSLWFIAPFLNTRVRTWIYGVLIVLFIFFGGNALYRFILSWYPHVRLCESVAVHIGPDSSYGICGHLKQGDEVTVYVVRNGWRKIKKESMVGWMPA